jgi:uncharacterized protein YraI
METGLLTLLNLDGVTISATIDESGNLGPVADCSEKIWGIIKNTVLPRVHTIIVHADQIGIPEAFDRPFSEVRIIRARTLEEAVKKIVAEEQHRWGKIPNFDSEIARARNYVGREWLQKIIDNAIHQAIMNVGPSIILVTGKPGVGKSSFVSNNFKNHPGTAVHFIHKSEGNLDDPGVILTSLTAQLRRIHGLPVRPDERDLSPQQAFHSLLRQVSSGLREGETQLIWIDGLDEAFGATARFSDTPITDVVPVTGLPPRIILLLTSRPGDHLRWLADPLQCARITFEANDSENRQDILNYLRMQSQLENLQLSESFIYQLTEASQGCFMAAERFLHPRPGLKNELDRWQKRPTEIPQGLEGWLNWQWLWLLRAGKTKNIPARVIKAILVYLAIPDELSRGQFLLDNLKADEFAHYRKEVVTLSSEFIEVVHSRGQENYRYFHPRFAEFILEHAIENGDKNHHNGSPWRKFILPVFLSASVIALVVLIFFSVRTGWLKTILSEWLFPVGIMTEQNTPNPTPTLSPTFTATPSQTMIPTLTVTATNTFVPTETYAVLAYAEVSTGIADLRAGPDPYFKILAVYPQGTLLAVRGRDENSTWIFVTGPDQKDGWIRTAKTQLTVDASELYVIETPVIPTRTITPTPPRATPTRTKKSGSEKTAIPVTATTGPYP